MHLCWGFRYFLYKSRSTQKVLLAKTGHRKVLLPCSLGLIVTTQLAEHTLLFSESTGQDFGSQDKSILYHFLLKAQVKAKMKYPNCGNFYYFISLLTSFSRPWLRLMSQPLLGPCTQVGMKRLQDELLLLNILQGNFTYFYLHTRSAWKTWRTSYAKGTL